MGYIAKSTAPIRLKAFLVGCCDANGSLADVREYLAELGELVDTLGVDVCGEMSVRIREPNPKFYIGSGKALRVVAPFIDKPKSYVVKVGHEIGVPFELTWSCYEGHEKACGVCGTCRDRRRAFAENDLVDPIQYEADTEE